MHLTLAFLIVGSANLLIIMLPCTESNALQNSFATAFYTPNLLSQRRKAGLPDVSVSSKKTPMLIGIMLLSFMCEL